MLCGRVGDWRDTWVCCCLQLLAPIGRSPLPTAFPLHPLPPYAAMLIGLSPCALPLPPWRILLSTHPSFPLVSCANTAPGLSLFHCSVSGPHRGGQPPSPLAKVRPSGHPIPAVGNLLGGGGSSASQSPQTVQGAKCPWTWMYLHWCVCGFVGTQCTCTQSGAPLKNTENGHSLYRWLTF